MCGAVICALSASMLSHFSTMTAVSGPILVCAGCSMAASMVGPYSMQPFSASTLGTLARNAARKASRMPGFTVMMAMTWIMSVSPLVTFKWRLGQTVGSIGRQVTPARHARDAQRDHRQMADRHRHQLGIARPEQILRPVVLGPRCQQRGWPAQHDPAEPVPVLVIAVDHDGDGGILGDIAQPLQRRAPLRPPAHRDINLILFH